SAQQVFAKFKHSIEETEVLSNADEILTSQKNAPQNTDFPSSDPYSRVARGVPRYVLRALVKSDHIEQAEQVTRSAPVSKILPLVLAQLRNELNGQKARSKTLVEE